MGQPSGVPLTKVESDSITVPKEEKRKRTEWLKGTGDGYLVWDINGNGKIDSNTEMMSEFDAEGNKVFENGFEKLQHYFDHDKNGVIEGKN